MVWVWKCPGVGYPSPGVCEGAEPRLPLAGSTVALGPESNVGQPEAYRMVSSRPRAVATQCRRIWCWTYTQPNPTRLSPLHGSPTVL